MILKKFCILCINKFIHLIEFTYDFSIGTPIPILTINGEDPNSNLPRGRIIKQHGVEAGFAGHQLALHGLFVRVTLTQWDQHISLSTVLIGVVVHTKRYPLWRKVNRNEFKFSLCKLTQILHDII